VSFSQEQLRTPLAPLRVEEGGECRDSGTIPGAYPKNRRKKKQSKQKHENERALKKRDKNVGGFELTVGRNTASRELCLEAARSTATTGLLEGAALGAHIGSSTLATLLGATRGDSEVAVSLTSLQRPAQQNALGTGRCLKGKLVESDALAFGLLDGLASAGGEAQSADGAAEVLLFERASTVGANIVSDGANNHTDVIFALASEQFSQTRGGHDRAVSTGHKEALQYNFVELGVRTANEEAIKLDEKLQVHVVALWGSAGLNAGLAQRFPSFVDTHYKSP
jgi:hypothetical protein